MYVAYIFDKINLKTFLKFFKNIQHVLYIHVYSCSYKLNIRDTFWNFLPF